MLYKKLLIFLAMLMVLSCGSSEKRLPVRKPLPITAIIADSLFTSFPGALRVNSKHLLLECPFDGGDGFLLIYDRETGQQLDKTGSIGQGPGEWSTSDFGNVVDDRLVVYDLVKKQYVLANADNMYQDISNPDAIEKLDQTGYKFIYLEPQRYIIVDLEKEYPFKLISQDRIESYGKYPFQGTINNTFARFQGPFVKHPQKDIVIYATSKNMYLAMYLIGKDSLELVWENQLKIPDYIITDNNLRWVSDQPEGIWRVAFIKDFIVCLVKDFQNDATGRDPRTAPKAVYLFDYKGKLCHIFDLPYHSTELAADALSNSFYSVCSEPDYRIVRYDLSTVGL